jgi:hypothetical protein
MSKLIGTLGSAWFSYGVWNCSGSLILTAMLIPFAFLVWKFFTEGVIKPDKKHGTS